MNRSRLRRRLLGFLILATLVAVAVLALIYVEHQITKSLMFVGATLSAIPITVTLVLLFSRDPKQEPIDVNEFAQERVTIS